ncbi:hypothetical protein DOK78_001608 [Enterococcus sp. DIV2402]|uniref:Uncharacterized protein n=1 Tax=Candidatus Enterococcus lowellii TaxID=2230877 RepID=A0ABZ2SPN0_9ENTE|nr:hypothetical protein [Enterococcus sp. DIV2402]MBO0464203.1 hypothetical protein [Enterococcus sp. DIV2402]
MIEFYEEAQHFVSYLTLAERKKMFYDLSKVLQQYTEMQKRKLSWNERMIFLTKPYRRCKQLFQFTNHHNEEIVIREVYQSHFFQRQYHVEVFYNFKETSIDFIQTIFLVLKRELYTISFVTYG